MLLKSFTNNGTQNNANINKQHEVTYWIMDNEFYAIKTHTLDSSTFQQLNFSQL